MSQKLPFFSIIIPTFNRLVQLAICLQSLAHQDYPREHFEVILVDDGSKTPPEAVVSSFQNRLNLTLVTQPHSGPAMARNKGAARAKGEFLAFTDDDCTLSPHWLKALATRFARTPDNMIGGRTLNMLLNNPYSTASHLLIEYLYSYYNANPDRAQFFTSNNLTLPTDRFHKIGGFDIFFPRAAAEDREFCERWLRYGHRMIYAPEVLVYHAHALTFRAFWRQHFNYGRGAFRFRQVHSQRSLNWIKLEPLPFYLNLLRYPFIQKRGCRALFTTGLLVISQVANILGFLWESLKQTQRR
jgi:glycosyltransferase involved in cell wall biosynthesis